MRGRGHDAPAVDVASRLAGVVDGLPVTAEWRAAGAAGTGVLLERADLAARTGDTLSAEDGTVLDAGLDAGPPGPCSPWWEPATPSGRSRSTSASDGRRPSRA